MKLVLTTLLFLFVMVSCTNKVDTPEEIEKFANGFCDCSYLFDEMQTKMAELDAGNQGGLNYAVLELSKEFGDKLTKCMSDKGFDMKARTSKEDMEKVMARIKEKCPEGMMLLFGGQ